MDILIAFILGCVIGYATRAVVLWLHYRNYAYKVRQKFIDSNFPDPGDYGG